ncbi:MAG: hypothetical protein ACI30P_07335 [Muribaculaceae bacterium]
MKKFYTFALAALLGSSVSFAGQRQQATTLNVVNIKAQLVEKAEVKGEKSKLAKAPAKVASIGELSGTYDWSYKSLLSSSPDPELVITIDDEATGAATISGFPQDFTVKATVDLEKGTVSIANNQDLGADSYGDKNYFYLKPVNGSSIGDGASTAAATVGTIDGTTITFPTLDVWAIGDPAKEDLGWWMMTYANKLTYQKEKVFYGKGTVSGDMFFTMFGQTPASYAVDVYLNNEQGTELLVKDPLKGLYAALSIEGVSPDMVIDATDPDNLLIPEFSLGIDGGDEDGLYYGMSVSANQQDIANTPEEYRSKLTKDEYTTLITIPVKGLFLWPSNTTSLYYANTSGVTIEIEHEQGGVNDIIADEENNAPVEFFNLQGQRVNNPAAGQLVIRRQGTKVAKVLVK